MEFYKRCGSSSWFFRKRRARPGAELVSPFFMMLYYGDLKRQEALEGAFYFELLGAANPASKESQDLALSRIKATETFFLNSSWMVFSRWLRHTAKGVEEAYFHGLREDEQEIILESVRNVIRDAADAEEWARVEKVKSDFPFPLRKRMTVLVQEGSRASGTLEEARAIENNTTLKRAIDKWLPIALESMTFFDEIVEDRTDINPDVILMYSWLKDVTVVPSLPEAIMDYLERLGAAACAEDVLSS